MICLVIAQVWPESKSSAAGWHMMKLMRALAKSGYSLVYGATAETTVRMDDLAELRIVTKNIQPNNDNFDEFIRDLNPSLVIFDRFMSEEMFGWRVRENCPGACRILNTQDLHGLRQARYLALKSGDNILEPNWNNEIAVRELSAIYRSDLSLIISEWEMNWLIDHLKVPSGLLHYFPFVFEDKEIPKKTTLPGFEERSRLITVGNYRHKPNADSLEYLKSEIWPLIKKKLPDIELFCYGAYPSNKQQQLHDPAAGFYVRGAVDSIDAELLKSRLLLAPLRFGAGLKGKIFDAMRTGTPFISTSIGIEGIGFSDDFFGLVGSSEEFAEKVVELYTNRSLWESHKHIGLNVLRHRFNETDHTEALKSRIESVKASLDTLRFKNSVGEILWHNSMAGNKYMSKWIAEKNKSKKSI